MLITLKMLRLMNPGTLLICSFCLEPSQQYLPPEAGRYLYQRLGCLLSLKHSYYQSVLISLSKLACMLKGICITYRDNLILSFFPYSSNLRSFRDGAVKKLYSPKILSNKKSSAFSGIRSEIPRARRPVQYHASHAWTQRGRLRELRIRWAYKWSPACSDFFILPFWLKEGIILILLSQLVGYLDACSSWWNVQKKRMVKTLQT